MNSECALKISKMNLHSTLAIWCRFLIAWCLTFHMHEQVDAGQEIEENEYCQRETMTIRCRWKSEVIVMTSARWGRMKTGRCLNIHSNLLATNGQDPMYFGCSQDVKSIVDNRCSGRSECEFRIQDELDAVTPCYPDLVRYLEASYKCVRVVQESRSCTVSVTTDEQYLMSTSSVKSDVNSMSSCGSRSHPWRLEAPLGQRINVSLLDFSDTSRDHDVTCLQYGYILQKSSKKNASICASSVANRVDLHREIALYTSDDNRADIVLVNGENNFLLKVNAVGCTNMIPPDNAWLKRSNNDIVVGCYLSQQTWHLTCDGHEWKGQVGTCPETYSGTIVAVQLKESVENSLIENVAMVIIAAAAVCLCALVVCVGCFCAKRYRARSDAKWIETSTSHNQPPLLKGDQLDSRNCVSNNLPFGDNNGFTRLPIESTEGCFVQTTAGS